MHDVDVLLEWEPVPDIPEALARQLDCAQDLLADYYSVGGMDKLPTLRREWEKLVAEERFSRHPTPFRAAVLYRLGVVLHWEWLQLGRRESLVDAKAHWSAAIEMDPQTLIALRCEHNLALEAANESIFTREVRLAESAVSLLDDCIARAHALHVAPRELALLHSGLAFALSTVHKFTGEAAVLDRQVASAELSCTLAPAGSVRLPRYHHYRAIALLQRFRSIGDLADLDAALRASRLAVELTPVGSNERDARLGMYAWCLRTRYDESRDLPDLTASIDAEEERITLISPTSPNYEIVLTSLGNGLRQRFLRTGRTADIDRAVDLYRTALQLVDANHVHYASNTLNLANGLFDRSRGGENRDTDTSDATALYREALRHTPVTSADYPSRARNLGIAHLSSWRYRPSALLAEQTNDAFTSACELGSHTAPALALDSSVLWGDWLSRCARWADAADAYSFGVRLSLQLVSTQSFREAKLGKITKNGRIHVNAAVANARARRLPAAALVAELGRAILLSEQLEIPALLELLRSAGRGDLADRYESARVRATHVDEGPTWVPQL